LFGCKTKHEYNGLNFILGDVIMTNNTHHKEIF